MEIKIYFDVLCILNIDANKLTICVEKKGKNTIIHADVLWQLMITKYCMCLYVCLLFDLGELSLLVSIMI